ncbi:MAG TPA: MFS transporter [Candidatus Paenibacillus intestinavium]|nr:MFS transporter [Candidatus Paenibacillus intestinavium]
MQDSVSHPSHNAKRETLALRSYSFITYSTQALVVSFLPLFFLDKGYNASQIGFLYSIGPMIAIFANMFTGFISDKNQTIVKLVRILFIFQFIAIGLLHQVDSFSITCFIMTLFYFCQTPINPLNDSLILLSSKYTGTPYALVRIFGSLGFALSAYSFGLILKAVGTGHTLNLLLITIAASIIGTLFIKDYYGSSKKFDFSGLVTIIKQPKVVYFFILLFFISTAHRMYEGFLAITLRQIGASDSFVGLAWLISAMSEIPVLFLLGKYGHKFKEIPLIIFASIMYALRMFLLSSITEPQWVVVTQLMHSITFGIYFTTALRYMSRLLPDQYRASGQAIFTIVWMGIAGSMSGLVGGQIYASFGHQLFYQIATAFAIVGAIGFFLYNIKYAES